VKQIAHKLDIHESRNPELDELEQDVRPETVLDALEANQERVNAQR
jgi:hypothetical protein